MSKRSKGSEEAQQGGPSPGQASPQQLSVPKIDFASIKLEESIGSGSFGEVFENRIIVSH